MTPTKCELGEVERALDARLVPIRDHRDAGADHQREQIVGRREEEQPEDGRQLAQREGMALAQEVDLDHPGLAEVEREGRDRPGDHERHGRRREIADDQQVDRGRREGDEQRERPHPDRRRQPGRHGRSQPASGGRSRTSDRRLPGRGRLWPSGPATADGLSLRVQSRAGTGQASLAQTSHDHPGPCQTCPDRTRRERPREGRSPDESELESAMTRGSLRSSDDRPLGRVAVRRAEG